eukprot:comp16644_c0_seq1/m.14840 comp16644_c0_seq1/g.14840  ORF comp16644_c0_seq1/g.14840 comp16644_c0_seq1/m.14840 type:complete len:153 (-) comp16644_c0_seq1:363-821(-)
MARADSNTLISLACVLVELILWWVALSLTRINQFDDAGGVGNYLAVQNHRPRDHQQEQLKGQGRLYKACMDNHFEGFAFFTPAVLANILILGPQDGSSLVAVLCVVWVVLRILHFIFYIFDKSTLRSTTFAISGPINIVLYILPIIYGAQSA